MRKSDGSTWEFRSEDCSAASSASSPAFVPVPADAASGPGAKSRVARNAPPASPASATSSSGKFLNQGREEGLSESVMAEAFRTGGRPERRAGNSSSVY